VNTGTNDGSAAAAAQNIEAAAIASRWAIARSATGNSFPPSLREGTRQMPFRNPDVKR
jgi:hypothetical protein